MVKKHVFEQLSSRSVDWHEKSEGEIFYQNFRQKLFGVYQEFSKKSQEFQKFEIFQN